MSHPDLAMTQFLPYQPVELRVLFATFKKAGIPPNGFSAGIPGRGFKGRIGIDNGPGAAYAAPGNIGGTTLIPGLYKFTSEASITGGDLTLTGGVDDVWIFQIGSTLTVGTDVHVILTGGAQARNVFWQVGSSATIGTSAKFKGTIMANVSITMQTGSTMEGRALAFTAVTFSSESGSLPTPEAPRFTHIFRTTATAVTIVLTTTPYFLLTLEACPDLLLNNWFLIATDTPISSPWTNTDLTATATVTQRFYRAFITP
jgi:hypothetical protein